MKFRWTYVWIVLLIVIVLMKWNSLQGLFTAADHQVTKDTYKKGSVIKVMSIGSSVAEGWDDPTGGGYLKRAFASFSQYNHATFDLVNQAKAGDTVVKIENEYKGWLKSIKPQIVVLAWGALDDLSNHTPMAVYKQQIRNEIALALASHAKVFVVTPPITRASYTQYKVQEAQMVNTEMSIARSFPANQVYVFDVFNQMKIYIASHHQTYVPYMGDGWHPNTKGHALAGQLLFNDMKAALG